MKGLVSIKGTVIAAALVGGLIWVLNPTGTQEPSLDAPTTNLKTDGKEQAPDGARKSGPKEPANQAQFITVEGSKFLMGAQSQDPDAPGYDAQANKDESPVRWVTVDSFAIQQNEVKARDYQACVDAQQCDPITITNPMLTVGTEDRLALSVNFVSWDEAVQYCRYINARLPTEAEWELAARGTSGQRFPFGDYALCASNAHRHQQTQATAPSPEVIMGDPSPKGSSCDQIVPIAAKAFEPKEMEALIAMVMSKISDPNMHAICFRMQALSDEETIEVLKEVKRLNDVTPLTRLMSEGELLGVGLTTDTGDSNDEANEKSKGCEMDGPPPASDTIGNHALDIEQLAGGMWEWIADNYADTYDTSDTTNPKGPQDGTRRVQRGGGWMSSSPLDFRGATRASLAPTMRMPDVGFRCARSL